MAPGPFLILHGYLGSGPGHWQDWLAARLRERGAEVRFPGLPRPERPEPGAWLDALRAELAAVADPAALTVVCHSLAGVLWLHHAAARTGPAVGRALLVVPPCPSSRLAAIEEFWPVRLDAAGVAAAARETRLAATTNDPYCPEGAEARYGVPLGLTVDRLGPAGHVNPDAGYGPWPQAEAWCCGDAAALSPSA